VQAGPRRLIALPRDVARGLARDIGELVVEAPMSTALVVDRTELRAGVWRLLRRRLPGVAVLSAAELRAAASFPAQVR
jgi:flagellar biosynthesis component FlhA